jgi:hypothetical protein
MVLASAASVTVSAVIAAGPVAALPVVTAPVFVVGALVVAPARASEAAGVSAFGGPIRLEEPAGAVAQATQPAPLGPPLPLAPAASAAAPVAPVVAQGAPGAVASAWRVEIADMNVRRVVERWSRAAGMQVIYEASKDVDVGAAAAFSGTYEHALQQLFAAIENSGMPLRACLYANAVTRVIPRMQRCD